ncbi:MAG: molybdopterin-binding protein [Hyphomicrobiaceae bacterium]|nr:molybdopterin-binding protein [Hyphomicrobiaceae bacterium]
MTGEKEENADKIVTAALLVIGDEILSGRTKDKNIGYVADYLTEIGIHLSEVRIVSDVQERIVAAVNALRQSYDYVFTTGGIGPTHDDITADAVAKAFGVKIDVDPRAVAIMEKRYGPGEFTPARKRMARIPDGAELVANSVSAAPGFMIENVIVMAGVPRIMQVMLDDVASRLRTGAKMLSRTVRVERPEGLVAPGLGQVQEAYPDVQMGSYPFYEKDRLGTHVVLRSINEGRLTDALAAVWQMLKAEDLADASSDVELNPNTR